MVSIVFCRYGPQFQTSIPSYMELSSMNIGRSISLIGANNKQHRSVVTKSGRGLGFFTLACGFFSNFPPKLKILDETLIMYHMTPHQCDSVHGLGSKRVCRGYPPVEQDVALCVLHCVRGHWTNLGIVELVPAVVATVTSKRYVMTT